MKRILFFLSVCAVTLTMTSCKKVEGPGGSSTITGKIYVQVFDAANNLINEYDGLDERVYLIYGEDDTFYDDDVRTSYDGTFEFNYLQNGTYKFFVYEKCSTCESGKNVIIKTVEITDKKSTIDLGTIIIRD